MRSGVPAASEAEAKLAEEANIKREASQSGAFKSLWSGLNASCAGGSKSLGNSVCIRCLELRVFNPDNLATQSSGVSCQRS